MAYGQRLSARHTYPEPSALNVSICRALLGKGGKFQWVVRPRRMENEVRVTESFICRKPKFRLVRGEYAGVIRAPGAGF